MIPISRQTRQRFKMLVEDFYEDEIEITGRVLEADVRQKRFQIWEDDQTNTTVNFTETQESEVTTALKEHSSVQLLVKGQGKFNKDGVLQGILNVKRLRIISDNKTEFDVSAPRIEDVIAEIFSDVPDHEWDKIPRDLSDRHDFYLYGDGEE